MISEMDVWCIISMKKPDKFAKLPANISIQTFIGLKTEDT